MTTIAYNLQAIRAEIAVAAAKYHRTPSQIHLLAVSKTFDCNAIRQAYIAGQRQFAESYVQEAQNKLSELQDLAIEWHFIGPIQSNKTRHIAENFAWVHSIDRLKIAQRLSEQRPANLPPLQVCLQINIGGEASKSGIETDQALELATKIRQLPNLTLRGLMTIPPPSDDFNTQRTYCKQLRQLYDFLNSQNMQLDTLSMGMSHDFSAAIAEGATIVRIGSAIFGQRNYLS